MNTTQTAVYLRVSTSQQDVQSQGDRVREYLRGHGITGARWFVDQGVSGATMVRPRFGDLQNCIFDGQIKRVIMYSLDRMSRVLIDGLIEIEKWRKCGVTLVFVDDCLEINACKGDIMGDVFIKIVVSMRLAFAEAEREKLRRRQAHGIESARRTMLKARTMRSKGVPIAQIAFDLKIPIRKAEKMCAAKTGRLYWGNTGGNKPGFRKGSPRQAFELRKRGISLNNIAAIMGLGKGTVVNYIEEERERRKKKPA